MLNYADTAWYVILRAVAAKFTQHYAQIEPSSICALGTCVAAISVSAVIEINVFDYNVHVRARARARAQCE